MVTQTVDPSVAAGPVCQALDDLATEFVGPGRRPAGRFCGGVFCGLGGAGEWSVSVWSSLPGRLDHGAMSTGKFAGAVASHLGVVQALGDVLAGTGKTFIGNGPDPTCDPEARPWA